MVPFIFLFSIFLLGSSLQTSQNCETVPSGSHIFDTKEGDLFVKSPGYEIFESEKCGYREFDRFSPSNEWEAWAITSIHPTCSKFVSTFNVPPAPKRIALLYLFPALVKAGSGQIIQPVLQYDDSSGWKYACWYIGIGGTKKSSPIHVDEGEIVIGNMTRTADMTYYCGGYVKNEPDRKTEITVTQEDLKYQPLVYITVELYGDRSNCDMYPSGDYWTDDIILLDDDGQAVEPQWEKRNQNPCTDIEVSDEGRVTIKFKN